VVLKKFLGAVGYHPECELLVAKIAAITRVHDEASLVGGDADEAWRVQGLLLHMKFVATHFETLGWLEYYFWWGNRKLARVCHVIEVRIINGGREAALVDRRRALYLKIEGALVHYCDAFILLE